MRTDLNDYRYFAEVVRHGDLPPQAGHYTNQNQNSAAGLPSWNLASAYG
jgi:hypothetical protein